MINDIKQPLWLQFSPHLMALAGVAALAIAFYSQYFQGAEPCILCLYQRVPFVLVIGLGLVGIFRPGLLGWVLPLAGLVFLSGSSIALYHVGVEQHWWISSCGGELANQLSTNNLMAQLQAKPEKACDELDWTLFGISMATYNVAYSGAFAVFCFAGALRRRG